MFKRSFWSLLSVSIVSIAVAVALIVTSCAPKEQVTIVRLGAKPGQPNYVVAEAIIAVTEKYSDLKGSLIPHDSGRISILAIGKNEADLVFGINATDGRNSIQGILTYADEGKQPILGGFNGPPSYRQLIARADSGIKTVADFVGKKVAWLLVGSTGFPPMTDALTEAYNLEGRITVVPYRNAPEAIDLLKEGRADVFLTGGAAPQARISELAMAMDIVVVPLSQKDVEAINKNDPAIILKEIPANAYKGQTNPVPTACIPVLSCVRADFPEDALYKVCDAVWGHWDEFLTYHDAAKNFSVDDTLSTVPIPLHPGMIKYLKDKKLWGKAQEARQKELEAQYLGK